MKDTISKRIGLLKTHFNLDNSEFISRCNISAGTLWNIQNGSDPGPKTIKSIAKALNANIDWITAGEGPMLLQEKQDKTTIEVSWKDEAYSLMKDQLAKKDAMIERLMNKLMGDQSFQLALNGTGLRKKEIIKSLAA